MLTINQDGVLAYIKAFIEVNGYAPTYAQIAEGLGFASATAAVDHVKALVKKGYLKKTRGIARGLVVIGEQK